MDAENKTPSENYGSLNIYESTQIEMSDSSEDDSNRPLRIPPISPIPSSRRNRSIRLVLMLGVVAISMTLIWVGYQLGSTKGNSPEMNLSIQEHPDLLLAKVVGGDDHEKLHGILLDRLPFEPNADVMEMSVSFDTPQENKLLYHVHTPAYKRLSSSSDYYLLVSGWDAQINQAFCAVATSVAILNSYRFLHPTVALDGYNQPIGTSLNDFNTHLPMNAIYAPYHYATQTDMFNECSQSHGIVSLIVSFGGLTLNEFGTLMKCHLLSSSWSVETVHADPNVLTLDQMRNDLIGALEEEDSRVAVNYYRAGIGQVGGGHFSPVGSYHKPTDSFLLMDVAKYKYPPVWVPAHVLYQGLIGIDACGSRTLPDLQWNVALKAWLDAITKSSTLTEDDLIRIASVFGCAPAHRGYVIVSKN